MIITCDGNIPSKHAHSFNVAKMAQGFCDAGQNVELISLLSWPNIREWLRVKSISRHYGISRFIKIRLLPVYNSDFFTKTTFARDFNDRAARYIASRSPNFVYCRSYLTTERCVKLGIKTLVETHTTIFDNNDLQKIYPLGRDPFFLGLITIHDDIKREHELRGIPSEKILVLEDGVDLSQLAAADNNRAFWRRRLRLPVENNIILYCGSLYREKGIQDILDTARLLSDSKKYLFVLLGGNKKEIREWRTYCKDKHIDNVLFLGFIANSEIPGYLRCADILLMPLPVLEQFKVMDIATTSPLKLFEYMGSLRPIVSTDVAAVRKIVVHNETAMLAKAGDIQQIAGYITMLIKDPQKSKELASNAFKIVKEYTWKRRCDRILNYYLQD